MFILQDHTGTNILSTLSHDIIGVFSTFDITEPEIRHMLNKEHWKIVQVELMIGSPVPSSTVDNILNSEFGNYDV
jgi:hypothetical protein